MARPDQVVLRREEILTHAAALFQERGFGAATMRHLAERVGMEASSLYNHFASKQAILAAICTQIANAYLTPMAAIEATDDGYQLKIESLLRLHIRLAQQCGPAVTVAGSEYKHLAPAALETYLHSRRDYEQRFEELIIKGIRANEFRPHSPRLLMLTLLAAVRWVEHPPRHSPATTGQQLEETIINLLMHGLADRLMHTT